MSDETTLAIAYGCDKTFIYFVSDDQARSVGQDLLDGGEIIAVLKKNGISITSLTTNNADDDTAEEAEEYESESDYWFDIYDMESVREALEP